MTDFERWESLLEAEGLGVIAVDDHWHGVNFGHIKGKHKRLDAMLNGISEGSSSLMTVSPQTARAVETRFRDADDEQSEWDDGLWDEDEPADNAWDLMILSLTGSPKEAEIADRRRAAVFGLDAKGRPRSGKVYRKRDETEQQYAERVAERLGMSTDQIGPVYSQWRPAAPFASADGGSGPLAIPTRPKPDRGSPRREEELRPSPVVDTDGYLPGRSPFQRLLAQRGVRNSDITG